ncbi:hypothetical protein MRY87_07040 [bacterium]|nr:hypothetical protein [bacterium]
MSDQRRSGEKAGASEEESACEQEGAHYECRGSHFPWNLLSCAEYSKLASKKIDVPLSAAESVAYWFHKMICMVCRRFERQLGIIERAAQSYGLRALSDEELSESGDTFHHARERGAHLSEAAKARMREKLEAEVKEP